MISASLLFWLKNRRFGEVKKLYSAGSYVFHEEYGWGRFLGVIGTGTRLAEVEFEGRGVRCFALPSRNLLTLRNRWKQLRAERSIEQKNM